LDGLATTDFEMIPGMDSFTISSGFMLFFTYKTAMEPAAFEYILLLGYRVPSMF
jgi:hypothetical protein